MQTRLSGRNPEDSSLVFSLLCFREVVGFADHQDQALHQPMLVAAGRYPNPVVDTNSRSVHTVSVFGTVENSPCTQYI